MSGTRRVDIRGNAATNRDLNPAVAEGKFRRDLFYRLNVFPILMPTLRQRVDDIPLLAHYIMRRCASRIGRRIEHIPAVDDWHSGWPIAGQATSENWKT